MAVLSNSIFESSLELCSFKLTFWKAFSANPMIIYENVFKNGTSQICGRQALKNLNGYGLLFKAIPVQVF